MGNLAEPKYLCPEIVGRVQTLPYSQECVSEDASSKGGGRMALDQIDQIRHGCFPSTFFKSACVA